MGIRFRLAAIALFACVGLSTGCGDDGNNVATAVVDPPGAMQAREGEVPGRAVALVREAAE